MRRVLFVVSVVCVAAALRAQDKPATELERIQGTWIPTSATFDGTEAPAELLKDRLWVISGDQLAELNRDRRESRAVLALDGAKKPAALDVLYTEGAAKGQQGRAIYKVEGEALTICMALPGERPTAFVCKRGSGLALLVFKRAR